MDESRGLNQEVSIDSKPLVALLNKFLWEQRLFFRTASSYKLTWSVLRGRSTSRNIPLLTEFTRWL
jgi:hypothetical protein